DNTFESSGATWAMLIGAPLLETHHPTENTTLIMTEFQYDKIGLYSELGLRRTDEIVSRYFPVELTVFMISTRWPSLPTATIYQPRRMAEGAVVTAALPLGGVTTSWTYEYGV